MDEMAAVRRRQQRRLWWVVTLVVSGATVAVGVAGTPPGGGTDARRDDQTGPRIDVRAAGGGGFTTAGRALAGRPAADRCAAPSWVATWAAAPQDSSAAQPPYPAPGVPGEGPQTFDDQTLRQVVTPTVGGARLRLHLSNRFGREPVTFGSVRVGRSAGGGEVVEGSDRAATFAGAAAVTIAPGRTATSDEIALPVQPFVDLAVSVHVDGAATLDVHLFAQQTQYATAPGAGDRTGDGAGTAFTTRLSSWLALSAIDVLAPQRTGAVVALGDSITDGVGSTMDRSRRWPDLLARRLLTQDGGPELTVVNAGIAGNQLTRGNVATLDGAPTGMGPQPSARFGPDVIDRAGVTDVVVFIGINDLYAPTGPDPAAAMVEAYRGLIGQARFAGLGVVGTTMTPGGLPPAREAQRQMINQWIRTSGAFDAVIDLDALVRDPAEPSAVAAHLAADPVHLNDAGYAAVADAFPLDVFRGTGC